MFVYCNTTNIISATTTATTRYSLTFQLNFKFTSYNKMLSASTESAAAEPYLVGHLNETLVQMRKKINLDGQFVSSCFLQILNSHALILSLIDTPLKLSTFGRRWMDGGTIKNRLPKLTCVSSHSMGFNSRE